MPTSLLLFRGLGYVRLVHCLTSLPDVPVFRMTSGARYSGVPHNVYVSPVHVSLALLTLNSKHTVLDLLCKAKVHQLKMPFGIDEYVLRLQIAVRNAFALVQEL